MKGLLCAYSVFGSGDKAVKKQIGSLLSESLNLRNVVDCIIAFSILPFPPSLPLARRFICSSRLNVLSFDWLWSWSCDLLSANGMLPDAATYNLKSWASLCHGCKEHFLGVAAAPSPFTLHPSPWNSHVPLPAAAPRTCSMITATPVSHQRLEKIYPSCSKSLSFEVAQHFYGNS